MATRFTRAWIVVLGLGLAACTPDMVKLDPAARASLKQTPEIKVVHYLPPNLEMQGRNLIGYGANAGASTAMQAQARDQVAGELMLADPVVRVVSNVVTSLSTSLNSKNLSPVPTAMQEVQIDRLKTVLGPGTFMDFATTYWAIAPLPYNPHDLVMYRARARVLKFPEGTLLWQGLCDLEAEDSVGMPADKGAQVTKGMLLANTFESLADRCSEQLVAQFNAGAGTR